jgi:hypothetical protein
MRRKAIRGQCTKRHPLLIDGGPQLGLAIKMEVPDIECRCERGYYRRAARNVTDALSVSSFRLVVRIFIELQFDAG